MTDPNNKPINESPFKSGPKLDKTTTRQATSIPDADFTNLGLSKIPKTVSSTRTPFPEIEKKLDLMFSHASGVNQTQIQQAKMLLENFLQGKDVFTKFQFGQPSKVNELLVRGLMNIYITSKDISTQVRAKDTVSRLLNPLFNEVLAKRIIETYNSSKYAKYPVTKLTDVVKWALEKSFEMYFNHKWEQFLAKNIGPKNTFIAGNFIGLMYTVLTGSGGTRGGSWFADYYNSYNDNPEKFTQKKAVNPSDKTNIDRSSHTVSDIIKHVYNPGGKFNPAVADNFNKANDEIIDYLQKNVKNPLHAKVFEYIVKDKLDSEEIMDIDPNFDTAAKITGAFRDLSVANKKASAVIDMIYKNYKLTLPSFSTWKTSDFNKTASDRGELEKDYNSSEVGRDDKGKLSKVTYDKFGEKSYSPLNELRLMVRNLLEEHFKTTK